MLVLARYVLPLVAGDAMVFSFPLVVIGIIGGVASAVAIAIWWLFFSRAPWLERVGVLVVMAVAFIITRFAADVSISRGMMGYMLILYAVPPMGLALAVWAAATRNFATGARGAALVVAILLACLPWTLVRSAGILGASAELHLRWTPTPEERLLSQENEAKQPSAPVASLRSEPRRTASGRASRHRPRQLHQPRTRPSRRRMQRSRFRRSGQVFADLAATASFAACASTPIGRRRLRL